MKKRISKILVAVIMLMIIPNVKASSCSVSASSKVVTINSKVTVYIKGSDAIGRFNLNSSNTSVLSGATSTWVENSTSAVTFTAKSVGTSTISVSPQSGLSNSKGNEISLKCNSVTISVRSKSSSTSNNTPKSSTNTLKSLSVDGAQLNPKFDKGTTEYSVTMPKNTEKIKINATKEDSKSTVTGTGEKNVSEGMNKFNIVVTAENGYKKTYTINVEVEEDPINVTVNNKQFSVIKKENSMPEIPNYYDKTTVKINDTDVVAYKGTITDFILVGLKDEEGNVNLYIYDEKNNNYTLYNELKFAQLNIYIKEFPSDKIPNNYKKYTEVINDQRLEVYKLNKNSKYGLIYGINVETGEKNIYKYDSKENTVQIYEREEAKKLEKTLEEYKLVILGLMGFSVLLVLIIIIILIFKKNKKQTILED